MVMERSFNCCLKYKVKLRSDLEIALVDMKFGRPFSKIRRDFYCGDYLKLPGFTEILKALVAIFMNCPLCLVTC